MYTASDVIEYLFATTGGGAQDQEHRVLRQALFHAYRDLVTVRDWRWYHATEVIDLRPDNLVTLRILPWGVQSVDSLQLTYPPITAEYVSPMEWERLNNTEQRQLVRLVWTVAPSRELPEHYEVRILNGWNGRPNQQCTLTYRRRPRDLRCTGWEPDNRTGTIAWDGAQATGTGTNWSNQAVGCVLRVSGDPKKAPESLAGMVPYRDEGLITGVNSGEFLTTWSPALNLNYTDTRFIITDYLDISPGMYTALLSGTEAWAARLLGKNIEGPSGVYARDLRMAFESDAVAPLSGRSSSVGGYHDFWWLRPGNDQPCPSWGYGGPNASGTCPIPPPLNGGSAGRADAVAVDGGNSASQFTPCGFPK
jgi:hypothetical protein